MTEEVKTAYEMLEESGVEPVMIDPVETKEIEADPLLATKMVYVDNLKKEIEGLKKQVSGLQYQLDIRVTALTMYQSALGNSYNEVVEEPKANKEDKV